MKNKNGFTLMELLGVIVILGLLVAISVPAVTKILNKNKINAIKIDENNLSDASQLLINDFCDNPISSKYKEYCKPDSTDTTTKNKSLVRKKDDFTYYICISDLKALNYYESDIKYGTTLCEGYVLFKNDDKKFRNGKTYVSCKDGSDYAYVTDETFKDSDSEYSKILDDCKTDTNNRGETAYNCVKNGVCN